MQALDNHYLLQLETLAQAIQESEQLEIFLDSEEEDDYRHLTELFEPQIGEVYKAVAQDNPLQLIALEQVLFDPAFEGMFLPRILGYAVLRGEVDQNCHYVRPQSHFKDILLHICHSSNFDYIKKRIGQTIQIGFALSSDIWITNMINSIENKRIRYFLQSQKLDKYRHDNERIIGYQRYKRQFSHDNYFTAQFPQNLSELKVLFGELRIFLQQRILLKLNNDSLMDEIKTFLDREEFHGHQEYVELLALYANFFQLNDKQKKHLVATFHHARTTHPDFVENYLEALLDILKSELPLEPACDHRVSDILEKSIQDDLTAYYGLMDTIHGRGYINTDVMEAVRVFYNQHEGLSTVNECVRETILGYITRYLSYIEEVDYHDYFELSRVFNIYIQIFANQHFNQSIERLSMNYVNRLLKRYTDKRGKDYQDIKRFVSNSFVDVGFLKEKEAVEMFKTRRKKKA